MEVQLVIKAPNQNIDDHVVHCNLDWTVQRLKNHLSEVYPNKPVIQEQKLIYSGRLLHDHLHLKDILRHEDGLSSLHILHLVCNGKGSDVPKNQHLNSSQDSTNQAKQSESADMNSPIHETNTEPSSENVLRHRHNPVLSPPNPFYPQLQPEPASASAVPVFSSDPQVLAQMAAMQQMYTYYFTQYMQNMNTALVTGNTPVFSDITNLQNLNNNPIYPPNETPGQRQGNQRLNAQGGQVLEENDDFGNRDWLDHLFLCCRFLILFCIVYFYSSPERLMIVIVCAIVAFLYHEGWFVRRPNPAAAAAQRIANNAEVDPNLGNNRNEPALANQNPSPNEELLDGRELEAAMDGDEPPHVPNPDVVNNNQIFSPLTFLAAFFSSLIPEPPPPVNIN